MGAIRILHFIDTLGAGGAERQLVYLLENLDRQHYECHVLATYDTFRHYEPTLRQLDIPLYSLHHGELRLQNRAQAFAHYVRLMWKLRPHIVHSWLHYPNLIARTARPLCPPHRLITAIRTEYTPRQQKSEHLTAWLSNFRIVNYKPTPKNPIESDTIHISNAVPLPTLSIPEPDPFTILMVARIDPRKDHLTLLEAASTLRNQIQIPFKVVLIGDITDATHQSEIANAISHLKLHEIVQQRLPTEDIANCYQASTITVLPSRTEGFSNVILESFAAAKPIIISEAANRDGLVQHGINGWVFPTGNRAALANTLEIAYRTPPPQRHQMGLNGRAIAEQYTIPHMVEQYQQLYKRALSRS